VVEAVDRVIPEDLTKMHELLREGLPESLLVNLEFEVGDPDAPSLVVIPTTTPILWGVYKTMHRGGVEESRALALFGYVIMQHLDHAGIDDDLQSFNSIWDALGTMFGVVPGKNRWSNEEDIALSFCYCMLRERLMTRKIAAGLAPILLTDDEPSSGWDSLTGSISVDAWRLRVDRWAERHKLDPVGIRQRQPK